ncbi:MULTISPECIES: 50S ribosomal protein L32 [Spiroplasma]|uniref:Uncharacterized protein n=2 Tax=Spiroplasma ixodetis TaxID=2141 RepID=A0ABN6SXP2_9MOLU|nr:50S ribosomal protein L32 [Spiroplasma ixodetis]TLF25510.1 MAG: 50S ribosomal protein L32 [Spiroplasma sp. WSS]WDA54591.1 MAG: 50S ribosomal protein L32 [Spiroplasma endosymbiont of Drosophila atripex]MBP1525712.1 50S ribosomal protein L32 [Spiroplasma ixodetis]MBP1527188.1 50S ribosomal protein L32 [Spiroplasma ixodetis]MBP1528366.1 50S ribosomal protein L32 [Spiroplasma ixodetis]
MAVPARRTSKMRKNTRRAHDSLSATTTTNCLNCGAITKPHHACMKCKTYKGVSITNPLQAEKTSSTEKK